MFVLVRAITYAAIFAGLVFIYAPARLLMWSGIVSPSSIEVQQIAGMVIGTAGALIGVWCVLAFATVGKGTPAPFDPPRRLVIRGPYKFVRNPMYIGGGAALAGAALFYESAPLWYYTGAFFLVLHLFIVLYEEPTLRRMFGEEYATYCNRVHRWLPRTDVSSHATEAKPS